MCVASGLKWIGGCKKTNLNEASASTKREPRRYMRTERITIMRADTNTTHAQRKTSHKEGRTCAGGCRGCSSRAASRAPQPAARTPPGFRPATTGGAMGGDFVCVLCVVLGGGKICCWESKTLTVWRFKNGMCGGFKRVFRNTIQLKRVLLYGAFINHTTLNTHTHSTFTLMQNWFSSILLQFSYKSSVSWKWCADCQRSK